VRTGHGKNCASLGDQGLFILARVTTVPVKMRDETAVLVVFASVQPEWQQLVRQMILAFFEAGRYNRSIKAHS
jgi:hypothetical protein